MLSFSIDFLFMGNERDFEKIMSVSIVFFYGKWTDINWTRSLLCLVIITRHYLPGANFLPHSISSNIWKRILESYLSGSHWNNIVSIDTNKRKNILNFNWARLVEARRRSVLVRFSPPTGANEPVLWCYRGEALRLRCASTSRNRSGVFTFSPPASPHLSPYLTPCNHIARQAILFTDDYDRRQAKNKGFED